MIRKLRKHFLKLFIAWVVLTIAMVFFALRSEYVADKAHHYILAYLEYRLQSGIKMERPEIAWLRGSLYIRDISIRPRFGKEERDFLTARGVRISFFPWLNILRREIGVRYVEFEEPVFYLRIERGGVSNLPSFDFLKGTEGFFRFKLNEIRVSGGRLDLSYPETPMEMTYKNIDMKVTPDIRKGKYGFDLAGSSAFIKVKGYSQKITSMKGQFRVAPENLTIINGTFLTPEGNVSMEGFYLKFSTGRLETKVSSELNLAAMREKVISGQWPVFGYLESEVRNPGSDSAIRSLQSAIKKVSVKGKVNISAAVVWSKKEVNITGKAKAGDVNLAGIEMKKVSAVFKADRGKIQITDAAADLFGGSLKGSLDFDLKGEKGFRGRTLVKDIDLGRIGRRWPAPGSAKGSIMVNGRSTGEMEFAGRLEPEPAVDASSNIKIKGLNLSRKESIITKTMEGDIAARVSYSGRMARVKSFALKTPSSSVSLQGDISGEKASFTADVDTSDLGEFYKDIKGTGRLSGRISGTISEPVVDGDIDLNKFAWGRYRADDISGDIRLGRHAFSSSGIRVRHGKTSVFIKGDVLLEKVPGLDLALDLEKGRLEDAASAAGIGMDIKGGFSAKGMVKGRLDALDGEIDMRGSGVALMGEALDTIDISGELVKGDFLLEKGEIRRNGEMLAFSGKVGADGDVDIRITSSVLSVENLPYIRESGIPVNGAIELKGDVSGYVKNPSFKGTALLDNVGYKDIDLGKGDLSLSVYDKKLTASGKAFGSEVEGRLNLTGEMPFEIMLTAEDLPLNPYFKKIGRLRDVTGYLSGTVEAEGSLSKPREISARGRISRFQIVRDPFFLKNAGDIEIEARSGKIVFKSFKLTGRGTELSSSGWIGVDGEANLGVIGNIDLYLLQLFTNIIEKGDGVVGIQLYASGKPPKLEGKVSIEGGVIGFRGFEPAFSGIGGSVTLSEGTLVVEELAGRLGEGRFKGSGIIEMDGISPKRTDITFDLAGVHMAYPRWLPSEVGGTLRLSGRYPDLLLSGDIEIARAMYSERIDWRTLIPSFKKRLAEPMAFREGMGVLKLDVNFKAEKNLIFDNNIGKGELRGKIRLKGDTSKPGIVGQIEVITGKVLYKEHEFKVTSGIIELPDPQKVEAILDISAEAKVRGYIINVQVQGNMRGPKIAMTSTPSLSETDIASLLSFGLTTKEMQERGGGVPAYGAVSFITREIEGRFKDYIGFDRFHIDPYYSRVTGTTEPKLTVGKEISEDVSVTYARSLSGTGEQEVQMEYKIYRNFSLVGGWSSFGESGEGNVGADVKYRFEFR